MILRCLFTESSIILPTTGNYAAPGESESRELIAELFEQPEVSGVLNTLSSMCDCFNNITLRF